MYQVHEDPLTKKFVCKHCGKAVRTRQGLSGHIQFKHATKQNTLLIAIEEVALLKAVLKVVGGTIGLPGSTTQKIEAILDNWIEVVTICEPLGIVLNKQDFKDYFVARLADMYQS